MNTVTFQTLDRRAQVVYRNFWFRVQVWSGGRFRDQGSYRNGEAAALAAAAARG